MCGIVFTNAGVERARNMMQAIKHRGPDSQTLIEQWGICLGHVRLAIVESTNPMAEQPIVGNNHITAFNGEIFNYLDLKMGTEIECLTKLMFYKESLSTLLNGYYAGVQYRPDTRTLVMCRDYFGVMPLYYTVGADGVVEAASERRALRGDVKEVPKNSRVEISMDPLSRCKVRVKRDHEVLRYGNYGEGVLLSTFLQAVHRCANGHSDAPVSVAYSGGLDSSLLLAAMKLNGDTPLEIITVHNGDVLGEEAKRAIDYVQSLGWGSLHKVVVADRTVPVRDIADGTPPNPIRDFAILRHATVAKNCQAKVLLCGEGLDEIGLGYPLNRNVDAPLKGYRRKISLLKSQSSMTLDRVNKAGMWYGKEYRVPFLDMDFVCAALGFNGSGKQVFRRYLAKKLGLPDYLSNASKYSSEETVGRAINFKE